MPIYSKEILKAPQKSVSKLLSIPKIYSGSKKPDKTKGTHKNTSKPNINILNKIEPIYSSEHFGLYCL